MKMMSQRKVSVNKINSISFRANVCHHQCIQTTKQTNKCLNGINLHKLFHTNTHQTKTIFIGIL